MLPPPLGRLLRLLFEGLTETAGLWPAVRRDYAWVWRVAHVLGNGEGFGGREVRRRLGRVVTGMARAAKRCGALRHVVKVTRSYQPGLFHCYGSPDVPRTNNELEQLFGSYRHHERRSSGRKQASPGLVVRGSVRLVAGLLTRLAPEKELSAGSIDLPRWRRLRAELERRQEARRKQRRFRRDPATYLEQLEKRLLKLGLPA